MFLSFDIVDHEVLLMVQPQTQEILLLLSVVLVSLVTLVSICFNLSISTLMSLTRCVFARTTRFKSQSKMMSRIPDDPIDSDVLTSALFQSD